MYCYPLAQHLAVEPGERYHQSVDARIDDDEHPDRRRHETNTGPSAEHGAGMMEGLEERGIFTLCEYDEGIDNLVELGQVEQPAIKGKPFIPQAAKISSVREVLIELHSSVGELPGIVGKTESGSAAVATRTVEFAESIHSPYQFVFAFPTRQCLFDSIDHAHKRPG